MDLGWLTDVFGPAAPAVALAVLAGVGARYASIEVARHRERSANRALREQLDEMQTMLADALGALRTLNERMQQGSTAEVHIAESLLVAEAQPEGAADWTPADEQLAEQFWAKLSPRGKALFGFLAAHRDERFDGEQLAARLDIPNGRFGVAGVLAWPGRHAKAVGRRLPLRWSERDGQYWMDEQQATLFAPYADAHRAN